MSIKSLFVLSIILSLLGQIICDLCSTGTAGSGCTQNEQWRQNLICRILGSTDANGQRQGDGYVVDALNIQQTDSFAEAKRKLRTSVSTHNLLIHNLLIIIY